MIDWRYRFGRGPVDQYRLELGIYRLSDENGTGRWAVTPLVDQLRNFVNHPDEAIGTCITTVT
jgi:hypothetical protein